MALVVAPPLMQQKQQQSGVEMKIMMEKLSLYVGDLDPAVTEDELRAVFDYFAGPVKSARLCRCAVTGKSLCYGYVNFYTHAQASMALATLNHKVLKGKPIRIMWRETNPIVRKNGVGNLFVKNLDAAINSARLENIFSKFGTILSCKVAEECGKSKGFGFVQFDSEDSAIAAQTALHDTILEGKILYASKFVKKTERKPESPSEDSNVTNLFVKNLAEDMTEDALKEMFSAHGSVSNVVIMMHGKSKRFGFVNFMSSEDASRAMNALNGSQLGSKTLFVAKAQKKTERARILKEEHKEKFNSNIEKPSKLHVNNLNLHIDDKRLHDIFNSFGKVLSAEVVRYRNGNSKGFGFVCFSSPEESKKALEALNGAKIDGRFLYVAIAKHREDQCQEMQNNFTPYQPQSFYPSNYTTVSSSIRPLYYGYPLCTAKVPIPQYPISYQYFDANFGVRYPYLAQNYQQNFSSYIPEGQMDPGSTRETRDLPQNEKHSMRSSTNNAHSRDMNDTYGQGHSSGYNIDGRDMNNAYAQGHNSGYTKNGNRRWVRGESTARGPCAIHLTADNFHGNSKEGGNGYHLHPLVDNIQPERMHKRSKMLQGTSTSGKKKKPRQNPPNLLALQVDRAVQALKEANALRNTDAAAAAAALPKSTRCLTYFTNQ